MYFITFTNAKKRLNTAAYKTLSVHAELIIYRMVEKSKVTPNNIKKLY